jgi:hypothetical protein
MDMEETKRRLITVRGSVFPAEWDDDNHVTRAVIDTVDQDEYFIENTKKGKELLNLLNRRVEVTGTLKEDTKGDFVICVSTYSILEGGGRDTHARV